MSTFKFSDPTIQPSPVFAGLAGRTGTGKTWSALRLMRALCAGRPFAMLDTEGGRGLHYHRKRLGERGFEFAYSALTPPYTPARYLEAATAAAQQGMTGLIIDSGSHVWESEGGVQEQAERIAKERAAKWNTSIDSVQFGAWREPKQELWQSIQRMKMLGMHILICYRAKNKRKPVKNAKGKTEIVELGTLPIIDEQVPFELDFFAILEPEAPGVPTWTVKALAEQYKGIFSKGEQLCERHGEALLKWSGVEAGSTNDPPQATPVQIWISETDQRPSKPENVVADLQKVFRASKTPEQLQERVSRNFNVIAELPEDDQIQLDHLSKDVLAKLKQPEMAV